MITINSFGTELSKDDRVKLFPTCGKLYPEGLSILAKADEYDQVKAVADYYAVSLQKVLSPFTVKIREFSWNKNLEFSLSLSKQERFWVKSRNRFLIENSTAFKLKSKR